MSGELIITQASFVLLIWPLLFAKESRMPLRGLY